MRRLQRTGWTNGQWADVEVRVDRLPADDVLVLSALDAAAVRAGRCAECTYAPLAAVDDLLVCKNCGAAFKLIADDVVELL